MVRSTLVVGLLCLATARPAAACSREVLGASRDEESAPIFIGRPSGAHSFVDPALGLVMTEYTVQTVECLRGACAPTATVLVIGGEVGDLVTRVAGRHMPVPNEGELIVLRGDFAAERSVARPLAPESLSITLRESISRSPLRTSFAPIYGYGRQQ
jgi:hypothetical protein